MHVTFSNSVPRIKRIPRAAILRAFKRARTITAVREAGCAVSVVFVSAARARTLNKKYRGKSYTPNVLSFPIDAPRVLGDVIICPEEAAREARARAVSFADWAGYLSVHGLLHLLGYGHVSRTAEREMERLAKKILGSAYPLSM